MSGLVEFLRARLDEEVAYFIAAKEPGWNEWDKGDPIDPDFRLTEVDAKRRIIDEYVEINTRYNQALHDHDYADDTGIVIALAAKVTVLGDVVLPSFALPYADHEDYRQEWKP